MAWTDGGRTRFWRGRWGREMLAAVALAALLSGCASGAAPAPSASPGQRPAPSASAPTAANPAPTAAPPPARLVANYAARGSGQSSFWYAYEGGFYRQEGLEVELTDIASTSPTVQAMLANEIQIAGIDAGSTVQASLSGADLVMLFAGTNRSVFSVMAQPEIREPQALRGKTIGITRIGSATQSAARQALELWGMDIERDVALRQLGQVPAILAGLEARQIDAGVLSLPSRAFARRAGYRELINLSTDGPEYPTIVISALRSWVASNEDTVRRVARAHVRAIHRARTDKPWALEVLRKYLQVDDLAIVEESYTEFLHCCPRVPYVSEEGLARLLADLATDEPRLAGKQPSDFIDARFLRELETSGFVREVMGD